MNSIIFAFFLLLFSGILIYFFKDEIINPKKVLKQKDFLVRERLKSFKTIDDKIFIEIVLNLKKLHKASLRMFNSEEDNLKKRSIKYNSDLLLSSIKKLESVNKPDEKIFKEIIAAMNYLSKIAGGN